MQSPLLLHVALTHQQQDPLQHVRQKQEQVEQEINRELRLQVLASMTELQQEGFSGHLQDTRQTHTALFHSSESSPASRGGNHKAGTIQLVQICYPMPILCLSYANACHLMEWVCK